MNKSVNRFTTMPEVGRSLVQDGIKEIQTIRERMINRVNTSPDRSTHEEWLEVRNGTGNVSGGTNYAKLERYTR